MEEELGRGDGGRVRRRRGGRKKWGMGKGEGREGKRREEKEEKGEEAKRKEGREEKEGEK